MPTLDLKQIADKLNAEFAGDARKLVFWYDDGGDFADEIDTLEIVGAKLHKLTPTNQFYTKYLLERQDAASSYLLYAPFPKPEARDNALEDTLLYSRRFYADRASLLAVDLGLDDQLKEVLKKHISFFGAKDRTQRFYDFEIEHYTKEIFETAIMSALCKTRTASFEEVLRVVLTEGGLEENNPYLTEFNKYRLLDVFWHMCEETLGYADATPTLTRLAATLLATYTARQLRGDLPKAWQSFVSYKSGSIVAFIDNLMNSVLYRQKYDALAEQMAGMLNVRETFENMPPETLLECDAFPVFDEYIIKWLTDRLIDEDTGGSGDLTIPTICLSRIKKHYGERYAAQYKMLSAAHQIIKFAKYSGSGSFESIVKAYTMTDYGCDGHYRRFYLHYDHIENAEEFERLRVLVENIYTNDYLGKLLPAWNAGLDIRDVMRRETSQLRFYDKRIKHAKEKVVVIISDALRYDVGRELYDKLSSDPNCKADIQHMIGALPAYTQLGMAALLPHKSLELKADGTVLVDGLPSDGIERREAILRKTLPNSRCVRADRLPAKRDELRTIFTGVDAVYVYHDKIDERASASEDEVFAACSEAVQEIFALIKRLSVSANVVNFIVTTDHGFLYKRERFSESEKINLSEINGAISNRRFIIADQPVVADGELSDIIGGDDKRFVSWPISANVFKTQGGLNFVHGGASPQEMILPLIIVKTEKGHVETRPAKIALVSMTKKITNLIMPLDFIQQEPVSDVVTATAYKLYFISDDNERISNEQVYHADKKDADPGKRMFRLKFSFKNKKHDSHKPYWLVWVNAASGVELFRHQVIMDIAFADGFGFDL